MILRDYLPELLAVMGAGAMVAGAGYAIWRGVVVLIEWWTGHSA